MIRIVEESVHREKEDLWLISFNIPVHLLVGSLCEITVGSCRPSLRLAEHEADNLAPIEFDAEHICELHWPFRRFPMPKFLHGPRELLRVLKEPSCDNLPKVAYPDVLS